MADDNIREIDFGGRMVRALPLSFRSSSEYWNEYLLDDGTVIRLKLVATEAFRLVDDFTPDGYPGYVVKSGNVMVASTPESFRRKPE